MGASAKLAPFLIGGIFFTACVPVPHDGGALTKSHAAPQAGADFPAQIAVFPMNNLAGDADGALILRALVKHTLEKEGYRIQRFEETDQIIRDRTSVGLEVPVQVAIAREDPKILTTWLGVDGILHGELLAFNRAQLSIYTRSQVKAHFWLTDRLNRKLWEGGQDADSGSFSGGGSVSLAGYMNDSSISPEALDKIARSPLGNATVALVDESFATFPRRP